VTHIFQTVETINSLCLWRVMDGMSSLKHGLEVSRTALLVKACGSGCLETVEAVALLSLPSSELTWLWKSHRFWIFS
jgi:hypothetical protein